MRLLILTAIILSAIISFGQDLEKQKAAIDAEVQRISKLSNLTKVNFSITALKKVRHTIHYEYWKDKTGYVKIERQFSHRNELTQQTFYLKNGELIYAIDRIVSAYTNNNQTDSIPWQGDFHFFRGKMIDHITLGHGKSETDDWDPEKEILTFLNEAKRDIERYKKKKNSKGNLTR